MQIKDMNEFLMSVFDLSISFVSLIANNFNSSFHFQLTVTQQKAANRDVDQCCRCSITGG